MEIRLKVLTLENFKGIKKFTFSPMGKNATIRGNNATGKTTVADAFRWLLFGKDTSDRADFAIKTLDPDGSEVHNLDHTVSGIIEIDGTALELKKIYKEKWTKKRGSAAASFSGHTTEYFIDDVPVQKNKWDGRLGDLINEDVFKLITLPTYFNSMQWQKRREILLQVCGDISDGDVIASDEDLMALPEILGDRSLEDAKKVISAEKKKINDRLKEIPARIDELTKSLPTETKNRKAIEAFIKLLDNQIQKAKDDTELSGLRKELAEAQAKLTEAQAKQAKDAHAANADIDKRVDEFNKEIRKLKGQADELEFKNKTALRTIERNEKTMAEFRANFAIVLARKQSYGEICPTCNQPLPQDQIEAARSRFNENQAIELASIQVDGKKLKAENETLKETIAGDEKKVASLQVEITAYEKSIIEAEKERVVPDPSVWPNEGIKNLYDEIRNLETQIKDHRTTDTSALEAERREEQKKLGVLDAAEKTSERIKDLGKEEKALAGKFEDLEAQLFLMEKFIVSKVELLEGKINSKFKLARFKLFDVQVNEGIKECCVTTVGGVPWDSVNSGAQIQVGLDIIKTLSGYYNVKAPIFIDHKESWTGTPDVDCQTISLVVDPNHKELFVDVN
ncbi:MAG: hypothetical protein KJ556_21505 [Gammaproteobacteria bacterium]|nr:hypothetical protein [Gammaproteobacteria bacterium]